MDGGRPGGAAERERRRQLLARLAAAQQETADALARLDDALDQLRATRSQLDGPRTQRALLHESALARALARLETQAPIEQAKGIVMAQRGCTPEEAFDVLRRASQRCNVPVRQLAADLVRKTATRSTRSGHAGRSRHAGRPPAPAA